MVARTWREGSEVGCTDEEWALLRAGFLGCGFRVVVPSGPARAGALARSHDLALEVARRVGGRLDEAPWSALAASTDDVALEVTGGWTHRFRAPSGPCHTRVVAWRTNDPHAEPRDAGPTRRPGVTLPWRVNADSPLTGLPALSGHHEARAATWLAGRVGVWRSTGGHLVDTTAGPPLLHTARGWVHPLPEDGTVPHHLWERACLRLGATAWRGPAPDDLTAVLCVAPDGRVTELSSLDEVALVSAPLERPRPPRAPW